MIDQHDSKLRRIDLIGTDVATGVSRLELAAGITEWRRGAFDPAAHGPAFEAHVHGNPGPLLANEECRAALEAIAEHGYGAGVIVIFHGVLDEVTEAVSRSGRLTAALIEGRAIRHSRTAP